MLYFPKHAATFGAFETILLSLLLPPSGNTFALTPKVPVLQLLNGRNSARRLSAMGIRENRPRNGKHGSEEKMEEGPSHRDPKVPNGEKPKQDRVKTS